MEVGRGVDAEDGGEARGVDFCFFSVALDCVGDSVEEEGAAEEFEEVLFDGFGYVGLVVDEIEVQLVIDLFAV